MIEAMTILGKDDSDAAAILKDRLVKEGIELVEGIGLAGVSGTTGSIKLDLADGRSITASHLLVAAGRRANIDDLGLEAAGIATRPGGIVTDRRLRTSDKRVFAIGDAAGRAQFTHIAGYHAGIVIRNMLFRLPAKIDESLTPWVTYTDPELAHVGLGEGAAAEAWGAGNIRTRTVSLDGNDRAVAEGRTEGDGESGDTSKRAHSGSDHPRTAGRGDDPRLVGGDRGAEADWQHGRHNRALSDLRRCQQARRRTVFTEALFSPRTRRIVRLLLKL